MNRVIGISGCTCSGKTTVTKLLLLNFPNSITINQDDYYYSRLSGRIEFDPELGTFNFDSPRAINFDALVAKLNNIINSNRYDLIFVDGSLIFYDEQLSNLMDRKYFIELTLDDCIRRRLGRQYLSSDPAGYFDKYVWPEYVRYREFCVIRHPEIIFINGSQPIDFIFEFITKDIFENFS